MWCDCVKRRPHKFLLFLLAGAMAIAVIAWRYGYLRIGDPHMTALYFIHGVEVKPLPSSEMLKAHPNAVGAYVHCYVPAPTEEEAIEIARESLQSDGYAMQGFNEIREIFRDGEWLYEEMPEGVQEEAEEALKSESVIYSEFFTYGEEP